MSGHERIIMRLIYAAKNGFWRSCAKKNYAGPCAEFGGPGRCCAGAAVAVAGLYPAPQPALRLAAHGADFCIGRQKMYRNRLAMLL